MGRQHQPNTSASVVNLSSINIGYACLSPEEALIHRGNKTTNVILDDILRKQLYQINSVRISSARTSFFTNENIERGIQALKDIHMNDGYINACESAYNLITLVILIENLFR